MKVVKKVVIVVIIAVVIFYLGLNIFAATKGKELLINSLNPVIGREVSINSLNILPPYDIVITGLEIEDFLSVEKIKVEPSILGLFFGKLGLNKLVMSGAEVSLVRISDTQLNVSPMIEHIAQFQAEARAKGSKDVQIFVKDIVIKDARVSLQDKTVRVYLDVLSKKLSVHTNPLTLKTYVYLDADIVSQRDDFLGGVRLNGWLNLLRKDMDAKFSVEDLEAAYFYPYLNKFLSKIESGKFSFSADAISKDNNLNVDCHLEAKDLRFSVEPLVIDVAGQKITLFDNLSGLILDSVVGPGGGGVFDFSIHTKFDNPKLEGLQFKGNIFKSAVENVIKSTPQETIDTIKSVGKDFESIGKEFKNVGKDFKEQFKGVEDVFKGFGKQAPEEQNTQDNNK